MLEADGNDPNLPLHSGPTPGPTSSWGFTSSGKAGGRSRERVRAPRVNASWGGTRRKLIKTIHIRERRCWAPPRAQQRTFALRGERNPRVLLM